MINFKTYLTESINDKYLFHVILLAGGPGSGKSFISQEMFPDRKEVFVVNGDELFEEFLNKESLPLNINSKNKELFDKQMEIRKKALKLTNKKGSNYVNGMLPIIIDGTGSDFNKVKSIHDDLTNIGYDCYMVFTNTTLDVAIQRNLTRKRTIPEELVIQKWEEVQKNIGKYKDILFGNDKFEIIDNNEMLVGEAYKDFQQKLYKKSRNILNSKISNPKGIKIIKYMKENGLKYLNELPYEFINKIDFKLV